MPVTIGINELAADLGLTDGTSAPRQPARAILELHLAAATPIIETWATDDCPDGVLNLGRRETGRVLVRPTRRNRQYVICKCAGKLRRCCCLAPVAG